MPEPVAFPSETKEALMEILRRAASQDRTVVEFQRTEGENGPVLSHAAEITEHVNKLEEIVNEESA